MRDLFPRLWSLLSRKEKAELLALIALMSGGAFMELLGLGLVMPVVAVLANPELLEQNKYLKAIHDFVNPSSNASFLLWLCLAVAVLYVLKNAYLAFITWLQAKLVAKKTEEMASALFENYVTAPYSFHLKRNSAELLGNINMAGLIAGGLFMPALMFLAECIVVAAILGILLFFAPLLTLGLAALSGILLAGLFLPFKKLNLAIGEGINLHSSAIFHDIMQGLDGIKECKVRNCEGLVVGKHAEHQSRLRKAEGRKNFLGQLPRFSIEAFVIMAGMGSLAAFVASGMATGSIVLKLSLFAVALIRLMPSFSRIQYQLTSMRQALAAFNIAYKDLTELRPGQGPSADAKPIELKDSIWVENVSFSYDGAARPALKNFSLIIKRDSSVAFVGPTGCGKTTLMDVILGLLKPSSGRILVDGRNIEENLPSWQKKIGYVPQFVYLLDASVRENVAFGENPGDIDDAQVLRCLETAQIRSFVEELPEGLATMVGERGVRLSGGQRQRIGIARALYGNPDVLALDEATSALDNDTERAFSDALKALKGKLTIIMIAHRLTTVQDCDSIVKIQAAESPAL
jgi:ABC-type bacteriocin/lantibiotic exporter with double-glycine peptidase domain